MAATDGRRLAIREEKLSKETDEISGIVPLKGIAAIKRIAEGTEFVDMCLTENSIMVRTETAEVYSRLIEGKFPDCTKVIPSGNDRKIEVGRQELLSFIRRAALLCSGESRAVKFSVEKDSMKLSSRTAEIGEAELSFPVSYSGDAMDIDFNPDYIVDMLRVLDTEKIVLALKNSECAGMIKDGKNYTYVVMPLNA